MNRTFTAIVYWEEDVYVAECPEVGTASQGETIEEAIANLKEATELYLVERGNLKSNLWNPHPQRSRVGRMSILS